MKPILSIAFLLGIALACFGQTNSESEALRIAVVQQDGNPGQVDSNRVKALGFATKALAEHADVILFHEELLVGYVKNLRELAEPIDGPTTRAFQRLLEGTDSLIIYGLTEKDGDKYYISAVVVSARGVVANYHKTHLYPAPTGELRNEPAFYTPGDALVTFRAKGYLCGLMICFDGDFPEMTRSYASLGCSVLFWMNNRGSRGYDEVRSLAGANSMIMATSCCTGKDESGESCRGGSNITDATGSLLGEIWDQEGFIIKDVYPGYVTEIRNHNPSFMCLRPELYRLQPSSSN